MSHHFDWTPETQDVSDVHCFAGASDDEGPRMVIGMNASPAVGAAWDPGTFYELKLDLNDDLIEDITWRFTFSPANSSGNQTFQVAQLTGREATSRTAPGQIIVGPGAATSQVIELKNGIKIFAGERRDSFFTDVRVPLSIRAVLPPAHSASADPKLGALGPHFTDNPFLNQNVRLVMVELPARITGLDPVQCWGTTAFFDTTHTPNAWVQAQRAAIPDVSVVFDNGNKPYHPRINGTGPSEDLDGRPENPATGPAWGVWGTVRDQIATVVKALGTYNQGPHAFATPRAYGAWAADILLPNVLRFTPGTTALWDPWNGSQNGKGLREELASNFAKMIVNQDFSTGLTQPADLLDYFPYLVPPVAS
ncbi:MAG TPA: DUF4331 family protein [Streptosporangiaceae bacterium]|jgi:hypothetical protein